MSVKYFEGHLDDVTLVKEIVLSTKTRCEELMRTANLKGYLDAVFELIADANDLVDKKEPFRLVKTDEAAAKQVLSELRAQILLIAELLAPVLPNSVNVIQEHYTGTVTALPPLFPRRDQK
jgi:methionyl-tRNA synthetase